MLGHLKSCSHCDELQLSRSGLCLCSRSSNWASSEGGGGTEVFDALTGVIFIHKFFLGR